MEIQLEYPFIGRNKKYLFTPLYFEISHKGGKLLFLGRNSKKIRGRPSANNPVETLEIFFNFVINAKKTRLNSQPCYQLFLLTRTMGDFLWAEKSALSSWTMFLDNSQYSLAPILKSGWDCALYQKIWSVNLFDLELL